MSPVSGTGSERARGRERSGAESPASQGPPAALSTPFHKYGNVFVRASRCPGAAGGSYERPMERGRICVERNGSERSEVASVANRKPPASPGHREGKRLRASARYE